MRPWTGTAHAQRGIRRWRRIGWIALCLALGSACASSQPPRIPPLTEKPTQLVTPGKFVWIDLLTDDVTGAKSFYGALFDWTFEGDGRYVRVLQEGTPIAGIVRIDHPADPERKSEWVGNLSVTDVDRAAALVRERGGSVERGPIDAPERGRLALVSDPGGAALLLLRASGGDPPDREPPPGRWLWRELWTHDVESAIDFYAELAGYELETIQLQGHPYRVLKRGEVPRAGLVQAPQEVSPIWLPYVRVEDPAGTVARARTLGARVVLEDEDAAILVDPTGAAIGVQAWAGRDVERAQ
jgi:predicted enzyme related to lactoylglutathione lyase